MTISERMALGFEGHPLECRLHPGGKVIGCIRCLEGLGTMDRIRNEEAWRLEIIESVRSLAEKRIRFAHRGRTATGLDCSGVFVYAATKVGIQHKAFGDYPKGFHGDAFVRAFADRMDEVDPREAIPSDALLVEIKGDLCHAMMLTERETVIHADARRRRVTEHGFTFEWADRVRRVFRFREGPR